MYRKLTFLDVTRVDGIVDNFILVEIAVLDSHLRFVVFVHPISGLSTVKLWDHIDVVMYTDSTKQKRGS
jgi:hypothetical protein